MTSDEGMEYSLNGEKEANLPDEHATNPDKVSTILKAHKRFAAILGSPCKDATIADEVAKPEFNQGYRDVLKEFDWCDGVGSIPGLDLKFHLLEKRVLELVDQKPSQVT